MAVPGVEPPDLAVLLDVPGGRLEVHYQPVVVLPGRHVVGFEALARVRRPDGVLLPPKAFVPAAERSGRIVPIGPDFQGSRGRKGGGQGPQGIFKGEEGGGAHGIYRSQGRPSGGNNRNYCLGRMGTRA